MIAKSWIALRETIFRKLRLLRRLGAHFGGLPERKGNPSRIYWLYQDASDLSGKAREKFLDAVRRDDESAYLEILSLLDDLPFIPPRVPQPLLKPGDTLGRYTIIEFIEEGGMGEVYKASHPELGVRVLKILSRELAENAAFIERLRLEAKAANALNHRNIVTIHDFDRQGHLQFMVMEFVEGQSLRKMIGTLPLEVAVDYATQMAQALGFAHSKGIIHRDIKPENVMVRPDGVIKILDFGLAKPVSLDSKAGGGSAVRSGPTDMRTDPHVLLGTLRYMAPEQLEYKGASVQSDIWSWGVVCYEMLAGRRPFEASTDHEVMEAIKKMSPGLPCRYRDLNRIVMKALRKEPDERYKLMTGAAEDLKKFIPPSWTRRAALFFLIALAVIAGYWIIVDSKNPHIQVVGQPVPLTKSEGGHATVPAISPVKTRMIYTEESRGESVLMLVEIVDGARSDSRDLARSRDAIFKGAAFAQNDGQTVYFLLQHRKNGSGILYQLRLASAGAIENSTNTSPNEAGSSGSSRGITLNFSHDETAPCQDHSPDVKSLAWYHRFSGSGRFEPICQSPPKEEISGDDSMDSPPSFSPDGRYFVFLSITDVTSVTSLMVGTTAGGPETLLLKQSDHNYLYPLWFPGEDKILTATYDSSGTTLWQRSLKNGKLVGNPNSHHLDNLGLRGKPAWLNNGLSIAASASTDGVSKARILQIPLNGGPPEPMLPSQDDYRDLDSITCSQGLLASNCPQMLIAAKEDGRSAVWVEVVEDKSLNRRKPYQVAGPEKFSGITWSDKDNLISESEYGEHPDLLSMNANRLNGSLVPITNDKHREKDPVVSPDGRYLVYVSNRKNGVHLWRIDLTDRKVTPLQLTFGDSVDDQPSISPNGQWIIFTSARPGGLQALWKVSINGGTAILITSHTTRNASMSVDGKIVCEYLLNSGPSPTWRWIIAILDENGQLLWPFPDISISTRVRWWDGESILYVREFDGIEDVWRKSIKDGGVGSRFTHFGQERIFAFALSPDGKRVACLCGHEMYSQIMLMRLAK